LPNVSDSEIRSISAHVSHWADASVRNGPGTSAPARTCRDFTGAPRLGSDWRWLYKREDTVWYPSVRVLRQSAPGAWDELLNRVAAEVRRRAEAAVATDGARG
jgi:hypothetical protein